LGTLSCNGIEVNGTFNLLHLSSAYQGCLFKFSLASLRGKIDNCFVLDHASRALLQWTITLFSIMLLDPLLLMLVNGPWMTTKKLNSKGIKGKGNGVEPSLAIQDKKESN
jgi:hypothetical protein